MKITKIITALALMGMVSSAHAIEFVIDHFNVFAQDSIAEGDPDSPVTTPDAGILGGSRTITLSAPDDGNLPFGQSVGWNTQLVPGFGNDLLVVNNGSGVTSTVTLLWDQFVDEDFTVAGANQYLTVGILSIDLSTTVEFILDDGTNSASVSQAFPAPGVFQIDLAAFAGVDETSVDSLTMILTGSTAYDAVFDLVKTDSAIPLPAPIALMGAGLLGLGLSRRKRA